MNFHSTKSNRYHSRKNTFRLGWSIASDFRTHRCINTVNVGLSPQTLE